VSKKLGGNLEKFRDVYGIPSNLASISQSVTEYQRRILWAIQFDAVEWVGEKPTIAGVDITDQMMLLLKRCLIHRGPTMGDVWRLTAEGLKYL
jgi:hypothetical protein